VSSLASIQRLPRAAHTGRVTQLRVVVSEWTKLRSLRSTMWSLFAAVLLTIAFPVLFAAVTSSHWGTMSAANGPTGIRSTSRWREVNVSQLAIAVLGVLVITGEYSTGMIRATFAAVPKRLPVCGRRPPSSASSRSF
jgi:ABC-type arginine transport system permease subunit